MTAADLGPDTLLWRYLEDRRFLFTLPRAVCLQSLHPTIATGITQHALLHRRVWLHHKRTVTHAIRIAHTNVDIRPYLRFAHEDVKGRDPAGNKYHALNPDVFHFQHATYVESLVMMVNTFIRKLDDDEHEQLYQECCAWYRRYGISTRPMPASWPEFCAYFEDECRTELSAGEHFEPFRRQMFAPGASHAETVFQQLVTRTNPAGMPFRRRSGAPRSGGRLGRRVQRHDATGQVAPLDL
ncbi:oxygenase MpaB family protein [Mycolicibacterium lutetiense]